MVKNPKVGEYWYCRVDIVSHIPYYEKEVIMLCRVLATEPIIVDAHYNNITILQENCLSKWEPNFFQRLLGYK